GGRGVRAALDRGAGRTPGPGGAGRHGGAGPAAGSPGAGRALALDRPGGPGGGGRGGGGRARAERGGGGRGAGPAAGPHPGGAPRAGGVGTHGPEPRPVVAVLTTSDDGPADWLRAGQALLRLLLAGSSHGLAASFLNQPLEDPGLRAQVRSELALPGPAQVVL